MPGRRALLKGKRLICLDVLDNYKFLQPELVRLLETKVSKYLPRTPPEASSTPA
ncbi:MAG: hypothetical protein AVDCRST_MAG39-1185 [uncultured Sphingomonadaceae bacterium]|uniref:Uncharacterized protein n=1 Tax=uncultured Sphingomonadaceae bacterium TaxID=169976 RepID=A0A6J4SHN4_9SPHN|nr:MAG: hypothetical protein AVDCRST_MAG39-1185 [uncultured Sphingomonadaceae bacterium]